MRRLGFNDPAESPWTVPQARDEPFRTLRVRRPIATSLAMAAVALAARRNGIVEIAGPERAPFNEIVARYLKAVDDPREVARDPEARYWGGRVEDHSLVPSGEARLARIGLDEWLRRSQTGA